MIYLIYVLNYKENTNFSHHRSETYQRVLTKIFRDYSQPNHFSQNLGINEGQFFDALLEVCVSREVEEDVIRTGLVDDGVVFFELVVSVARFAGSSGTSSCFG